jgi:hypothetical protein
MPAATDIGTVMETHTFEVTDPKQNFACYLAWDYSGDPASSIARDMAIKLTLPSGRVQVADNDPNSAEALWEYAPLEVGTWRLDIINQGSETFQYDLLYGFGPA